MIRIAHFHLWVHDQDEALAFYEHATPRVTQTGNSPDGPD